MAALTTAFVSGTMGTSNAKAICAWKYAPVCGTVGKVKRTFSNSCFAKEAGAENIKDGVCK